MVEQQAGNPNDDLPQPPDLPPIFLFDPFTQADLVGDNGVLTLRSNTSIDSNFFIDGHPTFRLNTRGGGVSITLDTPIDLDSGDWTVEFSFNIESMPNNAYQLQWVMNTTTNKKITTRFPDTGYATWFQIWMGTPVNASTMWRVPPKKEELIGGVRRFAIVCRKGNVTVFRDGFKELLTNWNVSVNPGSQVTKSSFPKEEGLGGISKLVLGNEASGTLAAVGNYGRIRISDYARYIHDYHPVAF